MTKAFQACCGMPWHITRDGLSLILTIANREGLDIEAVEARLGRKLENTRIVTERNGVAVIPVTGPIFRYANLFADISGATSVQVLAKDFTTALNDPSVGTILLNIDSPGGEANGIAEFADMVYAGRAKKKIVGYVGGYGTSAAYWIASACSEVIINESGIAGSIGTIAAIPDPAVEHASEVIIVSSQSPRKHADPTTEQGHADIQAVLDALTDVFVAAVARNRGVTPETVLSDFGQGGLFVGQAAVAAGLVDRLGAFEETLTATQGARQERSPVQQVAPPPARAATPPTLVPSAVLTPLASLSRTPVTARSSTAAAPPPPIRKESLSMSEPTTPAGVPADEVPADAVAQATIQALAGMEEQLTARQMELMQSRFAAMQLEANRRAEEMFSRWIVEQEQRQKVAAYAQHVTAATINRPYALPIEQSTIESFLLSLNADQRGSAQSLFNRILDAGLVSFEEVGSSGAADERDVADRWKEAVAAKKAAGLNESAAIAALQREQPDLYRAYNESGVTVVRRKGGR